jgi:hypothetical protein
MSEQEFWTDYELIRDEVWAAIETFYTYIEIHNFAADNKKNYRKINQNPRFWEITLYGLHRSFFIALGKVFDNGPDAHSIHKFIAACIRHPQYFSKKALAARKKKQGLKPDDLKKYMKTVYEPSIQDLRLLKKQVSSYRKKFDPVYKDIRDLVVAHKIIKDKGDVADLFSKTLIGEIEAILYFLYDLLQEIWQLYHNGREIELGVNKYDYKDRIKETTQNVLKSLTFKKKGITRRYT